jgi:hypothetical protein
MRLDTVESSMLHAVGYDPELRVLEVIFNSGGIYLYRDVPQDVYAGLMSADSKGQYFLEVVRQRYPNWTLEQVREAEKQSAAPNATTRSEQTE